MRCRRTYVLNNLHWYKYRTVNTLEYHDLKIQLIKFNSINKH